MAAIGLGPHHDTLFKSVFPPTDYTTPTPEATPDIGVLSSPGRPFGGFNIPTDAAHEAVQVDRAWSTATRYLAIRSSGHGPNLTQHDVQAFDVLLAKAEKAVQLAEWHLNEIRSHFRNRVLAELTLWQQPVSSSTASELVNRTVHVLQTAQGHYLHSLDILISSVRRTALKAKAVHLRMQVFKRWHSLILHSFPKQRLQRTLASALYQHMRNNLGDHSNPEKCLKNGKCQCRLDFRALPLKQLHEIGLGGDLAERALALATHRLLNGPAVERRCFQVDWSNRQTVVPRVRDWIEACVAPAIAGAIGSLIGAPFRFSDNDVSRMATTAVSNLVRKRTDGLFDYVKLWPNSTGALLDIKEHIVAGSTTEKASVCAAFANQIQHRLLHAGATTAEILSIYVNVIHVFKLLDARGVLLEKVAVPIRSYLRARDDTVSIIAASFLADVDDDGKLAGGEGDKICVDITREVQTSSLEDARDHKTLNWDDMKWIPDPIDAGPDHKLNKSEDVLSYILGLFDQEEFIKEVTTVLAQHLLQGSDPEFAKETRLVELFKSRFDPSKLQAAEVMLKDMRDSVMLEKRIFPNKHRTSAPAPKDVQDAIPIEGITMNALYGLFASRMNQPEFLATINLVALRRGDLYYPKRGRLPSATGESARKRKNGAEEVDVSLRILSSFFWPELRSSKFNLPEDLIPVLLKLPELFARYSSQRTLEWQDALARMSVTLELEDRTISETDIPAWRGSVINAFATQRTDHTPAQNARDYDVDAGLTSTDLEEKLQMDPELVADALSFWLTKRVLYQRSPGHYFVLESLDMDTGPPAPLMASESEAFSAIKSQDAMLKENAPMFETFIANMLQNGGAKEVSGFMGITNMLKMVLPIFTYGEEEVLFLLGEMEGRGEVVRNGEMWAIAK